jgi:hypothetical protein
MNLLQHNNTFFKLTAIIDLTQYTDIDSTQYTEALSSSQVLDNRITARSIPFSDFFVTKVLALARY